MKNACVWLLLPVLACAPVPEPGSPSDVAREAQAGGIHDDATLVPPGYGTLRQDDFTISLQSGPLLIKVTPLHEAVIRLAAPDTYDRLHALAESRRATAEQSAGPGAELFLVSFFSYEPDVTFRPDDLQLIHRGRLSRAVRIVPITPGWGTERLRQQETQTALYVLEPGVDYEQPITVRYGFQESDEWSRVIARLEIELGRVRGRVGGR